MEIKNATLANGNKIPQFGLGTYLAHSTEATYEAIKMGYRLIDTAEIYENSEYINKALKQVFAEKIVTREQLFITSKLWISHRTKADALKEIDREIAALGLDYLDLYLLHWPIKEHYVVWQAIEEAYLQNKIRAIGVCNYAPSHFEDLFKNDIRVKPMLNQIELHPGLLCLDTREYCQKHNILIQAWRSLFLKHQDEIFNHPILQKLIKKYGCTVPQLLLSWAYCQDLLVIPKSVHKEWIAQNLNAVEVKLDQADIDLITTIDSVGRLGPELNHFWDK